MHLGKFFAVWTLVLVGLAAVVFVAADNASCDDFFGGDCDSLALGLLGGFLVLVWGVGTIAAGIAATARAVRRKRGKRNDQLARTGHGSSHLP